MSDSEIRFAPIAARDLLQVRRNTSSGDQDLRQRLRLARERHATRLLCVVTEPMKRGFPWESATD